MKKDSLSAWTSLVVYRKTVFAMVWNSVTMEAMKRCAVSSHRHTCTHTHTHTHTHTRTHTHALSQCYYWNLCLKTSCTDLAYTVDIYMHDHVDICFLYSDSSLVMNGCSISNGGCEGTCIDTDNGRFCLCPAGYHIGGADRTKCIGKQ